MLAVCLPQVPRPRGARLVREGLVVRGETGEQPDQESRSEATEPQVYFFLLDAVGYGRACTEEVTR